jgi:hypothetical protein
MQEIEQLIEELKQNSKVINYLAGYDPNSSESFIKYYANIKYLLLKHGESYKNGYERRIGFYKFWAEKYYWLIAQKKLFNLQCLWRAEKIDLPVSISYEFTYWGRNIKACPFIEPVTEEELKVLIDYLDTTQEDCPEIDNEYSWQEYDEFKESEAGSEEEANYPDWYTYYDTYFGTPYLLFLPNICGEREERYLNAWRAHEYPQPINTPVAETRPFLQYNNDQLLDFIRAVEPHKIVDYFKFYRADTDYDYHEEALEHEVKRLLREPGDVIIPEGKFPDVIYQAAHRLKIEKVKELLLIIHEEEVERREMGISRLPKKSMDEDAVLKVYREGIATGKQLLGDC